MKIKKRFFKISFIFFKMIIDFRKEYTLIKKKGYEYAQKKMRPIHEKRARQLYKTAVSLQGVLIKLCQFFSSRRDIFPDPYIRILASLQDDVPSIDFSEVEKILNNEYSDHSKIFKSIESTPLASASLGQVHRAKLYNDKEVVIKVLKPGIERIIDVDFAILFYVFKFFENFKIFKNRKDLEVILNDFVRITGDELNFEREIYILKKFRIHLNKFNYLIVPEIYEEFCTQKIIVMKYYEGNKISNINEWKNRNNDPNIIIKRIIEIYFEQFFNTKLIHFDPHPGNILVTKDNNLVLLDFGMSGTITEHMRKGLFQGLQAFKNRDSRLFIDMLYNQNFIKKDINRYTLIPIAEFFFDKVFSVVMLNRESIQSIDITPIFREIVNVIYTQPFNIPTNWAYVGKTLGGLAGLISILNPNFQIYEGLIPHINNYITHNFEHIIYQVYEETKSNINSLVRLPNMAADFMLNLENGYYKIHVDYSEIHDKVDEVKEFFIKTISFLIFSISAISSYYCYSREIKDFYYIFLAASVIALFMAFFFRRQTMKKRIEKFL